MSRKLTYADVAVHTGRHDLYVIIQDKVLDLSKFVEEHPGGEEVLVDQAGKDATVAFEDVGHSADARQILETLVIGTLDKKAGPAVVKTAIPKAPTKSGASDLGLYVIILLGILAVYGVYRSL